MKKFLYCIGVFLFLVPNIAHAEIIIHEIAWMGTSHSTSDEWIELANTGSESVPLAGWKLHTADNSLNISLSGSIAAKGFYLLERTDDTTVPDIAADKIYTGALSDSGEKLILENNGSFVQTLDFSAKWPAGNSSTNQTMQWSGNAWVTAAGTPKAANAGASASTADAPAAESETAAKVLAAPTAPAKITPHVAFAIPAPMYSGMQYEVGAEAVLEYMTPGYGHFVWNFGDGTYITKDSNTEPVQHIYQYPGIYTISFAYYRASHEKKPMLMDSRKVEVFAPTVGLMVIDSGKALVIKNEGDKVQDLSDWHIDTDSGKAVFPPMSLVAPKSSVTFLASTVGVDSFAGAHMYTPFMGFSTVVPKVAIVLDKAPTVPRIAAAVFRSKEESVHIDTAAALDTASTVSESAVPEAPKKTNHRTKQIILGAVILTGIGLFVLLERVIAQKE